MTINTVPVKISTRDKKKEVKRMEPSREVDIRRRTLKELEEKMYPFPDSDVAGMLEDLLEKKVIELSECKRPEEMNRVNDHKFYKYHRIVSHPVEKCFVLKELIMNLARQGRIELDVDEIADANVATIVFGSFDPVPLPALSKRLEFQSTKGIHQVTDPCTEEVAGKPNNQGGDGFVSDSSFDDNEGWTLVTRRKPRTERIPQRQNTQSKRERRKRNSHKRSKTKTRIMVKRDSGQESGPLIQEPRIPITLEEYFPKIFFVRGPTETVYMTTCYQVDDEDVSEGRSETHEEQKVLTQVEDSPSHFNIEEVVELPKAIRIALVKTLMDLNIHPNQIREAKKLELESQDRAICCATCASITFTDEDLLLGSKPHNRPFFVSGYVREQKLSRMLVDGGSAVNIMPKSTMIKLGITVNKLSRSRLMIQGFNQGGQRAMGMIRIELVIGDLKSNTLFHVIDAKTSYNLLLGRPWVHENGIVPSTLHQCFKFYRGGVKKILGDVKAFTEAESYFADAKFYIDEDVASEVIPIEVHSTGQAILRKDEQLKCLFAEENSDNKPKSIAFGQMESPPIDSRKVAIPVLRYVSSSQRKEGQSPFGEEVKPRKLGKSDMKFLKESTTMPLPKLSNLDVSKSSVPGFVRPLQDATRREYLPVKRTKEGFDPNAYKLMSKAGLGFTPVAPVKISARRKEKKAEAQHISIEVVEEEEEPKAIKRASVFDRLAKPTQRTSVFSRIKESTSRPSVFKRISRHQNQMRIQSALRRSALERLGVPSQPSEEKSQRELESGVLVDSTEDNEIRSLIPSRMKRLSTLDVTSSDQLKVKRRTIIQTRKALNQQNESDDKEVEILVVLHVMIEELDEEEPFEDEVYDAPAALEDGGQATVDELKELNLGTNEDPRPIFVSALLNPSKEESYHQLLLEYKDVFAWTYKEMPGLDPKVAVHQLVVKPGTHPIKQTQRRFRPELLSQIEAEVDKLIAAEFIREVKYSMWIANIVPVKKKITGQIRICVDFRDLNEAFPKDDFPLPIIELMVDATIGHEALSFMDGSSGSNQIRMSPEDEILIAFRTPKGIYCYKVMPFGLKNAGATYQRAMQKIFGDMLHKNVECYIDDLVIKSKKEEDHLKDLRTVFNGLRKYQLKMNPLKCAFGVTSGRCQPFNRLMKKDVPFVWDEACHNAFESIKKYLSSSPLLGAPIPGKQLKLYIAVQERLIGALLAQENESHKEQALYYLSRTLTGPELNYTPIEKTCLALVFAIQKLRHYMQAFTVHLIARADPVKYVMSKPVLTGRLAKWALLLNQYEIIYTPAKAVKGIPSFDHGVTNGRGDEDIELRSIW
ncbi:uncharacterized protein LOC109946596 [Prunus persica]|uniref:uncharacterized protein LOC109946596 n=1 Tax=Prunus persica TaxID=3760 RepID=UPI0009ABA01A|nr:uncharacterized protein LOC109946596 [Prunus persica]